jgi:hypothetical protein
MRIASNRRLVPLLAPLFASGLALAQAFDEGPEPNDFTGTPTVVTIGSRVDGELTAGDIDYYFVNVPTPGLLRAYTSYGRGSIAVVDTVVEFRDSTDALLAVDDDSGTGLFSYGGCNIATPGNYFIAVRGFAGATVGAYTLDMFLDTAPLVLEAAEPNNGPLLGGVPSPAVCGSEHVCDIAAGGDEDWWSFTHPGGPLSLVTGPCSAFTGPAAEPLEDTIIDFYSSASVLLGSDDDGGEVAYSALGFASLPAGQYFVSVYSFNAANAGTCTLRISCGGPVPLTGAIGPSLGTQPGCVGGCGTGAPTLVIRANNLAGTGTRVRPRIGTTYVLDVANVPPVSIVVNITGLALFPVPIDLGPLGAPSCFVGPQLDLTAVAISDVNGRAKSALAIPNVLSLSGFTLHWQSASVVPCQNAFGIATSNSVTGVIGDLYL